MKRFLLALTLLLVPTLALAGDNELTAVGTGVVQGTADEGYITVGVTTIADEAGLALKVNTGLASKLYKSLEDAGVERKNIKTIEFSVADHYKQELVTPSQAAQKDQQPVYQNVKDGFQVTNTIRITVCELNTFGAVLDTLVANGATVVHSINFGSSKAEQYLTKARAKAAEDATRKATTLANGLGIQLSGVNTVTEQQVHGGRELYSRAFAADAAPGDVPVSGGSLTYTVQVVVVFRISASPGL